LTHFFADLPAAKIFVPAPSVTTFILYYLFLWLLVSFITSRKKSLIFLALILVNLVVWREALGRSERPFRVTFLDVSQGSSVVVQLPNDRTLLINAGQKEARFDAGEYVVTPFLNHRGLTKIDKVVLTDPDSSSVNSIASVLRDVEAEGLVTPRHLPLSGRSVRVLSERIGCDVQLLESLETIRDEEGNFEIRFLEYPQAGKLKPMRGGILARIRYGKVVFCLLDGMKRVHFDPGFDWKKLAKCSVLVLPELGSSEEISRVISAIRPQKVLFTRHYFRYEREKIPLLMQLDFPDMDYYRTAESGAVICESDGSKLRFKVTIE
jgi:beta-lactamase superfamily II metal-dependent hydrolase